jgi:hypothetical protein
MFRRAANPAAILALIERLRKAEKHCHDANVGAERNMKLAQILAEARIELRERLTRAEAVCEAASLIIEDKSLIEEIGLNIWEKLSSALAKWKEAKP